MTLSWHNRLRSCLLYVFSIHHLWRFVNGDFLIFVKYWKLHLDFYGNVSYNIFVDIFRQGEISLRWFHRRFGALHIFLIQLAALMWRQVKIFLACTSHCLDFLYAGYVFTYIRVYERRGCLWYISIAIMRKRLVTAVLTVIIVITVCTIKAQ